MKRGTIFVMLLYSTLLFNLKLHSQQIDSIDFFPRDPGDRWIYLNYETPPFFHPDTEDVSQTKLINDTLYTINYYLIQFTQYYRKDLNGNIYGRVLDRDQLLLKIHANVGDSWTVESRGGSGRIIFCNITLVDDSASINTQAGIFHNCKEYFVDAPIGSERSCYIWLAPDVGVVRCDGSSISYKLKRFEINGYSITPRVFQLDIVYPWPWTSNVDVNSIVFFNYNSIPPETVQKDDFNVTSKKDGIITGTWRIGSPPNGSCIFTPDQPLPELDTITITLFARIIDWFGDSLDGNFNWKYDGVPQDNFQWTFYTGRVSSISDDPTQPDEYLLIQNYPNPFNSSTVFGYEIPQEGFVIIKIFDALGREITSLVNQYQKPGNYNVEFNATNLSSGMYIYQLTVNNFRSTKKMMLIR
jgi:hypothetical protein